MDKNKAQKIIEKHCLVPGSISRKILNAIINNNPIEKKLYAKFTSTQKINNLRKLYQEIKIHYVSGHIEQTRYWVFHKILDDMYVTAHHNNFPRINNLRLSLLSLLLRKANTQFDSRLIQEYPFLSKIPKKIVSALDAFMQQAKAIYPSQQTMQQIVDWIFSCKNKNESNIFIPICPDYATELTGDTCCPYRHTFATLGCGLGPVALRILDILPMLNKMLSVLDISPAITVGIADFEAFSTNNLKAFGLTEKEFLDRVIASKNQFEEKSLVKTIRITDLAEGKNSWIELLKTIKDKFAYSDFGSALINEDLLLDIAKKRKALYTRWYGEKSSLQEYVPIILEQGSDYSAMGAFISQKLKNCLIIGADASVFVPFYGFSKSMPVLYLEKNYC